MYQHGLSGHPTPILHDKRNSNNFHRRGCVWLTEYSLSRSVHNIRTWDRTAQGEIDYFPRHFLVDRW